MDSKKIIEKRLEKFKEKLRDKGIEAAFITKRENYMYLSGFTGTSAYLIITQEEAVLVTDFRYEQQAAEQAPFFHVIKYQGDVFNAFNELLEKKAIQQLGFEESDLTYKQYTEYKNKLQVKDFIPLGGIVETMRMIKDQEEIKIIRKAVEIADNAFTHVLTYIKPGITEIEIAAELEYSMKRQGAKGPSFETIVASGGRSSMPHGTATDKKIKQGDTITLDFGAIYKEYCSDMTRTVFVGEPSEEMKRIYAIVLEAQRKSLEGAKKGLTGKEIDSIARDLIVKAGFEKNFGHGLGHGVGIEVHEEPRLSPSGNIVMDNNMVVTVEPGIYVPRLGGVRIEDMIVIQDDKPLILTKSTKELVIV